MFEGCINSDEYIKNSILNVKLLDRNCEECIEYKT